MKRFEMSIEVGPIDLETVERLRTDGYAVFPGGGSWRIQRMFPVLADGAVWAQAHYQALEAIDRYRLVRVTETPVIALRNPDAGLDERSDLLLEDVMRSYDPMPLPRPKGKWYQREM